jgi:tetratricopeptide (TPR) repeat protein
MVCSFPGTVGQRSGRADPGAAQAAVSQAAQVKNSAMDGQLLFELLVSEMALGQGDAGTAYEWTLNAARRTRDESLFRRATDIALQARAGEQALAASRAWRQQRPESTDALRLQPQILLPLNRPEALPEPLKALLALSLRRQPDRRLPRFCSAPTTCRWHSSSKTACGPIATKPHARGGSQHGTRLMKRANTTGPVAGPGRAPQVSPRRVPLLALNRARPTAAEAIVQDYLRQANAEPGLRMVYVRTLTAAQRYADAAVQLETATRLQPNEPGPYLSLGALHLELKQPQLGEAALLRYLELAQATAPASTRPATPPGHPVGDEDDDDAARPEQGPVQAWLMLAQAAEQRGDFKAAEAWLARIEDPRRALEVQGRRAAILARQGKLDAARELIRKAPERGADDARAKVLAEAEKYLKQALGG